MEKWLQLKCFNNADSYLGKLVASSLTWNKKEIHVKVVHIHIIEVWLIWMDRFITAAALKEASVPNMKSLCFRGIKIHAN